MIHYTRKPSSWEEIDHCVGLSQTKDYPRFEFNEVWQWEDFSPMDNFLKPMPRYFVVVRNGKEYLVNTEGATYARYVAEVVS